MTHARPYGPLVGGVQPPFYNDVIPVSISPFHKQFSSTRLSFGPGYEALFLVIFISDMSVPVEMLEAIMAFLPRVDAKSLRQSNALRGGTEAFRNVFINAPECWDCDSTRTVFSKEGKPQSYSFPCSCPRQELVSSKPVRKHQRSSRRHDFFVIYYEHTF